MSAFRSSVAHNYFRPGLRILFATFLETKTQLWKSGKITPVILQFLSHLKSSSISQLINGKSRDLQKLLKYFRGTTTSSFILLALSGVLPIFCLILKRFTWCSFVVIYLITITITFILIIIYNNSTNFLMS